MPYQMTPWFISTIFFCVPFFLVISPFIVNYTCLLSYYYLRQMTWSCFLFFFSPTFSFSKDCVFVIGRWGQGISLLPSKRNLGYSNLNPSLPHYSLLPTWPVPPLINTPWKYNRCACVSVCRYLGQTVGTVRWKKT